MPYRLANPLRGGSQFTSAPGEAQDLRRSYDDESQ